ncbi:MAG: PTS sugar transporter subunit IIA [Treponema sp.]|jgi:lichenan operon transcriptional antiterminator|nr:PTS sugar transporter subunit IIA [Treponema sp.]
MYSRHKQLLNTMLHMDREWIISSDLAALTNSSVRTVKNYIAELNSRHKIIISSKKGYRIDKAKARELLSASGVNPAYESKERSRFILKKLLTSPDSAVDLFELCEEELFVSLETINKDMVLMRRILKEFELRITVHGTAAHLEGSELSKRKALSNVLYEEFSEHILSLTSIEKVFPRYNVRYAYSAILDSCKQRHFFINEYTMLVLVLDMMIGIDRIKNDCSLPGENRRYGTEEPEKAAAIGRGSSMAGLLAKDITRRIEHYFHITYNESELDEITMIISSSLIKTDLETITMENINVHISKTCAGLIRPIKKCLDNYDFIDTSSKYMSRFILHVDNLLLRLANNYERKNPLTEHIKTSCPMIFECAVSLSGVINKNTGFHVGEHETAYIAIHIGSFLKMYQNIRDKVCCVLLFPGYYDYEEKMIARFTEAFGDSLVIQKVLLHAEELDSLLSSTDLVVSIMQISGCYKTPCVCVNPFITERDIAAIREQIEKIQHNKKKQRLLGELKEITNPGIFCRDIPFASQDEAIRYLAALMAENGYVEDSFVEEVLLRERSYSTAYGSLAVPHSMQADAKKTGMCILLNRKPFSWNQNMVNIVLLFSVQRDTRPLFYDIFDNLIVLLLESSNKSKILDCHTYDEFIQAMAGCL